MKSLYNVFEEAEGASTPANTVGMGNPTLPNGDQVGSGDQIVTAKCKKEKKRKTLRDALKESIFDTDISSTERVSKMEAIWNWAEGNGFDRTDHDLQLIGNLLKVKGITRRGDTWYPFADFSECPLRVDELEIDGSIWASSTLFLSKDTIGIPTITANNHDWKGVHVMKDINLKTRAKNQYISIEMLGTIVLENMGFEATNVDIRMQSRSSKFPYIKNMTGSVDTLSFYLPNINPLAKTITGILDTSFEPVIWNSLSKCLFPIKPGKAFEEIAGVVAVVSKHRGLAPNSVRGPIFKLKSGARLDKLIDISHMTRKPGMVRFFFKQDGRNMSLVFLHESIKPVPPIGNLDLINYVWRDPATNGEYAMKPQEWFDTWPVTEDGYKMILVP